MSSSEIKCPSCGNWTPGNQANCIHCGALVDPALIDQKERDNRAEKNRKEREAAETRIEKYLKKLQQSENPFARFLYTVLNIVWIVYMAIVSFVIWFTAIFSG